MSLVGVYPNERWMTREQLLQYVYFLESHWIVATIELEDEIERTTKLIHKLLARIKELEKNK